MRIDSASTALRVAVVFFLLLLTLASIVVAAYFLRFHGFLSSDNAVWGQFGDYIGGILNPILGSFSFVVLLLALQVQAAQSATAALAYAQSKSDSAQAGSDFARGAELLEAIAKALQEQSQAMRDTTHLLAISHALHTVDQRLREEQDRSQLLATDRLMHLREQRDQLTARLLAVTAPKSDSALTPG